ncbi:MAG: L-lactate dehydrogenase [Spirochaetaceae bacterium]|jgi:L-lactate dehydrogenase|nr:L-lactate dehydrogenase [Spirochaetaceae bacterium]
MNRRVTIIGTGNVGAATAFSLATQGLVNEMVLIDVKEKKSEADVLDLRDATARLPVQLKLWANDWDRGVESDIVIISAGPLPRPDQTRLDTLEDGKKIINDIIPRLYTGGFGGIIINITNPCDVISHHIWLKARECGASPGSGGGNIFGTGTSLDSLRLRRILAELCGVAPSSVEGYSMGEHGDSQMVPWSQIRIGGKPFLELREAESRIKKEDLANLVYKTSYAGWEVLLRKGYTNYGIATATADLVRAVCNDEKRIVPVAALLRGEYGLSDLHIGVPAVIGAAGVEKIVELDLSAEELGLFHKSAELIKSYIAKLN